MLILGGTGEARELAGRWPGRAGLRVVSSLAGRVADPALPAGRGPHRRLRRRGRAGRLAAAEHQVAAVVDATHPFAETISANAAAACAQDRHAAAEPGRGRPGRRGRATAGMRSARCRRRRGCCRHWAAGSFLTTGRQGLAAFAGLAELWFLIRCVDPPARPLPARCEVILARGPYDAAAEQDLMREHRIDVLVTKNSGGALTAGKLAAARELGIPVVMAEPAPAPGRGLPLPDRGGRRELGSPQLLSRNPGGCAGRRVPERRPALLAGHDGRCRRSVLSQLRRSRGRAGRGCAEAALAAAPSSP